MKMRLTVMRMVGAVVAYGGVAWFLGLVGTQTYRWFRDGDWPHLSISDGLLSLVTSCCAEDGSTGMLANFANWLDAPESWLGLHKVLEVVPASIGLFSLSVLGNFVYIYCSDRLDEQRRTAGDPKSG
jgi:hypothetical protein